MVRVYKSTASPALPARTMESDKGPDTPATDFTFLEKPTDLALRPRAPAQDDHRATVAIHPLHESYSFIASVQPPKVPQHELKRASCDIVLVIDVSGSMAAAAPLPEVEDGNDKEAAGLSVLDLVKHAVRTILETLGPEDRLGIVTFSDDATVVQELKLMSSQEKTKTRERIENLRDLSCTNLWAGIRTGLDLFSKTDLVDNVQGLYILTDGMPNHMCPKQGYVNKLGPMMQNMASKRSTMPTIHTFGFGYQIRSGLMQSIAEVGNGNYAFIPDAGMIGTAFVHVVANLYTTFGTSATLEIEMSDNTPVEVTGALILKKTENGHALELGNIQYGQSRDVLFVCPGGTPPDTRINITLKHRLADGSFHQSQGRSAFSERPNLPRHLVHYHLHRAQLCHFVAALFPRGPNGEHVAITETELLEEARKNLSLAVNAIQTSPCRDAAEVKSLLDDLVGDGDQGQITKALTSTEEKQYWNKWGHHYLPSLLHAHQRQMCNTFKDPGPLMYGKDSPLFVKCCADLDAAFDSLPAPKPSRPPKVVDTYDPKTGKRTGRRTIGHTNVSMKSYNSRHNPCFEGNCLVRMGDGTSLPIKELRPGMLVWTPFESRKIAAVLKTRIHGEKQRLCRIGELLVTPWHPIQHEGRWVFPNQIAKRRLGFKGSVYSVLLAQHTSPEAHALEIGGRVCVTLGHGIVSGKKTDVRAHPFFGSYNRVILAALQLPVDKNQHLRCGGLVKDVKSGLACGFARHVVARGTRVARTVGRKVRCLV